MAETSASGVGGLGRHGLLPQSVRRGGDPGAWLTMSGLAWVLGAVSWLLAGPPGRPSEDFPWLLPAGLLMAVLLWGVARQPMLPPRTRSGWRLMCAAWVALIAASVLTFAYHQVYGAVPFPSAADLLKLAYYPLMVTALARLSPPFQSGLHRRRFLLDVAIALAALTPLALLWLATPIMADSTLSAEGTVVSLAYLFGDVLVLVAVVWFSGRDAAGRRSASAVAVSAAVLAVFAGNLVLMVAKSTGSLAGHGHIADALFLLGQASMLLAARNACRFCGCEALGRYRTPVEAPALRSTLPFAIVGAAYALLLYRYWSELRGIPALLVYAALTLSALVYLRQMLGMREFVDLLSRSEARFASLVRHSSDAVVLLAADQRVVFMSDSSLSVLGLGAGHFGDQGFGSRVHEEDRGAWERACEDLLRGEGLRAQVELRVRDGEGRWRHVDVIATNQLEEPAVGALVLNCRDVTERKQLEEKLEHLAFTDPLTLLCNRNVFGERVAHAIARASRDERLVPVLFLDLDNFKTVNDSLGHMAGDELLVATAQRLVRETRPGDTVARLGGDEFAVLLDEVQSTADVLVIAERILESLRRPYQIEGRSFAVPASIGVAVAGPSDGVEELLRNADLAMYEAKSAGKSCLRLFEPQMHVAARDRLELQSDLRRVLEREGLELHYQPVVDLRSGRYVGCEALLRWKHPQRGWIPPSVFVPVAEESGLVVQLGRWTLREVCVRAAAWREMLGEAGFGHMAVNVSALHLQHPGFQQDVEWALRAAGLPASALTLEITETALMHETEQATLTLQRLKALGVRIAIDDFGTGYSSLSYLHRFPIDILKVDRSFVQRLGSRSEADALARSVIALGQTLQLEVVAEGVETPSQLDDLAALGCNYAQGFLFSRPLPAGAMAAAWRSRELSLVENVTLIGSMRRREY